MGDVGKAEVAAAAEGASSLPVNFNLPPVSAECGASGIDKTLRVTSDVTVNYETAKKLE